MSGLGDWRPIETAPRDGTLILAGSVNHDDQAVVGWRPATADDPEGHWDNVGAKNARPSLWFNALFFTHWMPRPASPQTQGKTP